jgi:hypothetical protein
MLALLFVALLLDESRAVGSRHAYRAFLPLLLFFVLIVRESTVARPSDQLIMDAIHGERHTARRTVLIELGLLAPAVLTGLVGWWLISSGATVGEAFRTALHGRVHLGSWSVTPLEGFATAASGYIIAGAVGWAVRIVFTLAFGKEAFGTGDIHLMAAAGCVAGWPVVILGFFLTCGLAMIGWLLSLPFKWTRALPLGPWLSLSILAVVVFFDAIIRWPFLERAIHAGALLLGRNSQAVPGEHWP